MLHKGPSEEESRDLVRGSPRISLGTRRIPVGAQQESRVLQESCFPLCQERGNGKNGPSQNLPAFEGS